MKQKLLNDKEFFDILISIINNYKKTNIFEQSFFGEISSFLLKKYNRTRIMYFNHQVKKEEFLYFKDEKHKGFKIYFYEIIKLKNLKKL